MSFSPKFKEHNDYGICKSHSARTEKDGYRISPSKLNKQELEDLYFTLIENNLQLKKTVNAQQEQIKLLSTKIQRITAQKSIYGKYDKKCCTQNKVVISQHEDVISELKLSNEKLSEKVRNLNMRLCSAKQFLTHSPLQISKCHNYSSSSFRNVFKLHNDKQSHPNLRMKSTSSQYLDQDVTPLKLDDAAKKTTPDQGRPEQGECTQNKCRAAVDHLDLEVSKLNKELSRVHEEYTRKIVEMEKELSGIKEQNVHERAQCRAAEDDVRRSRGELQEMRRRLRNLETENDNIRLELTLERQSVLELRTELRAAALDQEEHLPAVTPTDVTGEHVGDSEHADRRCRRGGGEKQCNSVSDQIDDLQAQLEAMRLLMERGAGDNLALQEPCDCEHKSLPSSRQSCGDISHREGNDKNTKKTNKPNRRKNRIKNLKENNKILSLSEISNKKRNYEMNDNLNNEDIPQYTNQNESEDINGKIKEINMNSDDKDNLGYMKVERGDASEHSRKLGAKETTNVGKIIVYKDIGVQSVIEVLDEKKYVSRAVGAGVIEDVQKTCAVDASVQIDGEILYEKNEENFDTKTYTRRKSASASHKTYSVEVKLKRSPSRDNTQGEISSLSDLTADSKSSSDYISPGEERPTSSTLSESYDATTTDWELSEGELPAHGYKRSYGEVKVKGNAVEQIIPLSPSVKVGEAIRAVQRELSRCTDLLRCGSYDGRAAPGCGVDLFEFLK